MRGSFLVGVFSYFSFFSFFPFFRLSFLDGDGEEVWRQSRRFLVLVTTRASWTSLSSTTRSRPARSSFPPNMPSA